MQSLTCCIQNQRLSSPEPEQETHLPSSDLLIEFTDSHSTTSSPKQKKNKHQETHDDCNAERTHYSTPSPPQSRPHSITKNPPSKLQERSRVPFLHRHESQETYRLHHSSPKTGSRTLLMTEKTDGRAVCHECAAWICVRCNIPIRLVRRNASLMPRRARGSKEEELVCKRIAEVWGNGLHGRGCGERISKGTGTGMRGRDAGDVP